MDFGKVFISSVLNTSVEDLLQERRAVREVVESYPFLKVWAFEAAPASPEELDESYLRHVEECDLFILVLGTKVTPPVNSEWLRAKTHKKLMLVFVKDSGKREAGVRDVLEAANRKYAVYSSVDELKTATKAAVDDALVQALRSGLQTQRASVVIHSDGYPQFYLVNPTPLGMPGQTLLFVVLDLTIENQGLMPTVIRKFQIEIPGLPTITQLKRATSVQGRKSQYGISSPAIEWMRDGFIRLSEGDAKRTTIVFYYALSPDEVTKIGVDKVTGPPVNCVLTLMDTAGNSFATDLTLSECGT